MSLTFRPVKGIQSIHSQLSGNPTALAKRTAVPVRLQKLMMEKT
jgi:hypothetical protein